MPTDTKVRIRRNPYSDYEVWIQANGELTRRTFSNAFDLSTKLVGECVDERVIEEACDQFERLEWEEPYPLFAECADAFYDSMERPPAAEAVTDCDCRDCQCGVNARLCDPLEPPTWQLYVRGVIWCGMLAMPWFCVVVALRWWAGK